MGLNPGTVNRMDIFPHIFVVKICNVCSKRPKINEKEAGVGPFKKMAEVLYLQQIFLSKFESSDR